MFEGIDFENELLQTGLIVTAILLGVFVVSRIALRLTKRFVTDPKRLYHSSKMIRRISGIVALVLIVGFFSPRLGDVLTVLTVIGAGLAIALREALLSVFGWFHISLNAPFKQGDRIEINGVAGDVVDIRIMKTVLMEIKNWVEADQSTGRIVHIPNNWIFAHALQNYSRGFKFLWNELSVTLTFRSNWQRAQDIMTGFANESSEIVEHQASKEIHQLSKEYLVHYSILTPFVYVRIVDNGVRLTLRYLCEARKRRGTEHALTISMLDEFRKHPDIEFAYPTFGLSELTGPQFGKAAPTRDKSDG
ncbi:MAG: mechanosensitive ion channel family protein [Rhodothermales bacterium]|nr:mechanosensitive ion channel family protein [Rhodothermales bacterium]